jgi:hypothetical protein
MMGEKKKVIVQVGGKEIVMEIEDDKVISVNSEELAPEQLCFKVGNKWICIPPFPPCVGGT